MVVCIFYNLINFHTEFFFSYQLLFFFISSLFYLTMVGIPVSGQPDAVSLQEQALRQCYQQPVVLARVDKKWLKAGESLCFSIGRDEGRRGELLRVVCVNTKGMNVEFKRTQVWQYGKEQKTYGGRRDVQYESPHKYEQA